MSDKKLADDFKIMANDGATFTLGELKRFLEKGEVKPSDLFTKHDLITDPIMKEAIDQGVEFELEWRDLESKKEVDKMNKENEEEEKDIDLMPEGSVPPSGPEKKREKKEESEEGKKNDLLPPGDEDESSEDTEDDQEDEEKPLLPG